MFLEMASPETISPVAEHNLQRRLSAFGSIVSALLAVVVAFGIGQMTSDRAATGPFGRAGAPYLNRHDRAARNSDVSRATAMEDLTGAARLAISIARRIG